MPNELRENIEKILKEPWATDEKATADAILSLIESERCVWTYDSEREWVTSCGNEVLDETTYGQYPFCPCCGKRITIVEDKNV